jgi:hypothetical protein
MILDRVFHGVLDHSAGTLIVFEERGPDVTLLLGLYSQLENI